MEESNKETKGDLYYIYLRTFYSINRRLLFTEGVIDKSEFLEYAKDLDEVRARIIDKE